MRLRIGVLASHGGSNMQAIIDACKREDIDGEVCVIISNNSDSGAMGRAEAEGIPSYHLSGNNYPSAKDLDDAILLVLKKHRVNIVALAGYMKKLGPGVLNEYRNSVLNIHPALLPKHGGKGMFGIRVHEAVIASGDRKSGATVHLVNDKYDDGEIVSQVVVPVLAGDTPEMLAERVLKEEHRLYPITLEKISKGEIEL